jgi:hypothetical protein
MATTSIQNFAPSYNPKPLCRIVGIACLAGFFVDLLILALPPALGNPEWRTGFLQQMSDRSIILLFGAALTIYGSLEARALRKQLGIVCLSIGVFIFCSCVLVIRDGLTLNDLAAKNMRRRRLKCKRKSKLRRMTPKQHPILRRNNYNRRHKQLIPEP